MLRLGQERPELRIVNDQRGAPTSSESIANVTLTILDAWQQSTPNRRRELAGRYHLTSAGETTWFDFAAEVFRNRPDRPTHKLLPIPSAEYPTPARRPLNSVLDCGKLRRTFGIELPHWRVSLLSVMKEIS